MGLDSRGGGRVLGGWKISRRQPRAGSLEVVQGDNTGLLAACSGDIVRRDVGSTGTSRILCLGPTIRPRLDNPGGFHRGAAFTSATAATITMSATTGSVHVDACFSKKSGSVRNGEIRSNADTGLNRVNVARLVAANTSQRQLGTIGRRPVLMRITQLMVSSLSSDGPGTQARELARRWFLSVPCVSASRRL